jgi:hypothetical protein
MADWLPDQETLYELTARMEADGIVDAGAIMPFLAIRRLRCHTCPSIFRAPGGCEREDPKNSRRKAKSMQKSIIAFFLEQ